jgi:replicative DNA helicase
LSLDLTVLRVLKTRERYERLARSLPEKALDTRTKILVADFGRFYREHPEAARLDAEAFMLMFAAVHKTMKDEDFSVYKELIRKVVAEDVDPAIEQGLMARLVAAQAVVELADLVLQFNEGAEFDLAAATQAVVDSYNQQVDRKVKNPQVLDPIEDLLKEEENDTGIHWRLPCLNQHIKPMRGGDFIVVAARPDKGKTTFISSEGTHWASQLDTLFPDEKRCVMWLNNEGPGRKIVTRCFQSALNATVEELVQKSNGGSIRKEYAEALGGRGGTLRIFDIHGMNNTEVEDMIRQHNPAVVVFDMIDNISFNGATNNNGQRTDQLLESMYQWARMLGVKYDCAMVATSQISAEGDGQQWPTLPMLKDSKTGKQGAADVIITIGTVNDPMLAKSRWIGTTKNKKARTGMPSSPMKEVMFDGDRGRYTEYPQ